MEKLYLSPSKIATYENCPKEYFLKYVRRVETEDEAAALGFGGAIGSASEAFFLSTVTGAQCDPTAVFQDRWDAFTRSRSVRYNTIDTPDGLRKIGSILMDGLPQAWHDAGFTIALDKHGKPLVERNLELDLGDNVYLRTKLDLAVYNRHGQFGVIDVKTSKTPTTEEFLALADQLTAYQCAMTIHALGLGTGPVEFVGFWEFLKRSIPKKANTIGPYINPPEMISARSEKAIQAYIQKARWVAYCIRSKQFPQTPRMAFNSPCGLCDFANYCAYDVTDGLIFSRTPAIPVTHEALAA